jgi:photosystem II stability/assembly factor-like uncharacterized protein
MLRKPSSTFLAALGLFALLLAPARGQEPAPLSQALQVLKTRPIGPANMSGRIVDVAVYEKEPRIMYVASAAGGLWRTSNYGVTWKPVFDRQSTVALGAVAVHPTNPNLVWVGTGEGNARNSVSWGDGVYKSTDGGKTWQHMGLKETHHIGRIVVHPKDPDIAYVAAVGHLWGPNLQRGLFKTTDGGKSWSHVLALGDSCGCVDVAIDPEDPDVLYAAAYQVRRDAFSGGNPRVQTGPGAGLCRTTDGGKTWEPMKNGLPDQPFGRCGLSIYRKDPNVVYAVVQTDRSSVTTQGQGPNNKKLGPDDGGIFRSDDKGQTWKYLNSLCPRPFYYGQIRVDPSDDRRVYVLGVQFFQSGDGGKTFGGGGAAKGTHSDYHALWIDPRDSHHLVLGCDGGLNFSFDRGQTWEHLKNLPVSQFYAVAVDMRKPYRVYGGLQDNGTWGGPSATRDLAGITIADWVNYLGYDGYYCQVDPDDGDTLYCEGQYGILRRVNVKNGDTYDIKPRLASKEAATNFVPDPGQHAGLRFNWSSPILLSPHSGKVVYYGTNHLLRSDDRGEHWQFVSPDLTHGKPGPNDYAGHTITTIAESPLKQGMLFVGTDDGRVATTADGGKQWFDLSSTIPGVPLDRWVSRVECSRFAVGTVYLAIDRHRNDDCGPYLFKSNDAGFSWTSLAGDLPIRGPVYVVREDPVNRDLLYAGTEYGLFISLDGGKHWQKHKHLPTVPVHDLVVHPRDGELVIATHGRGIHVMDVKPLQELGAKVLGQTAHLFAMRPATAYAQRTLHTLGIKSYSGENPPYGAGIYLYLREAPREAPAVTIADASGKKFAEFKAEKSVGLQRLTWRLSTGGGPAAVFRPVPAGTYTVTVRVDDQIVLKRSLQVEAEE